MRLCAESLGRPDSFCENAVHFPRKFDSEPLVVSCRYRFLPGAVYRLKVSQIPGHEEAEMYPTLEIAPSTPRAADYLAANGVPMELSEEDIDRVLSGKSGMKVIFLPDVTDPDLPKGVTRRLASATGARSGR
jgi:hypothetical protein